jgi:hypothetical protein
MTTYSAPDSLIQFVDGNSREESVHDHGFRFNAGWWVEELDGIPGGPVRNDDGTTSRGFVSRGGIFSLAQDAISDKSGEGALKLLWHSLHWGTSDNNRGNRKRIQSVAEDPGHYGTLLRAAAMASREEPKEAFTILKNGGRTTISNLNSAFLTKFLYFAGGGHPEHPSLIVDSRVLKTLNRELSGPRKFNRLFSYRVSDYIEALSVMHAWAEDASIRVGRPVTGDEVERRAFNPNQPSG